MKNKDEGLTLLISRLTTKLQIKTTWYKQRKRNDWVWCLIPVILALWEVEVGGLPEVRSLRPVWPTW